MPDGTRAVLYAHLDPAPEEAAAFYAWYEAEHVPGRLGVPGFRQARRFRRHDRFSASVMVYEVDDLDVFASASYRDVQERSAAATKERMSALLRFDRITASLLHTQGRIGGGRHLLVATFAVPEDAVDELDRWYAEEHGPMLLRADGWDGFRLFHVEDTNTDYRRVALHELSDLAALDSPERAGAARTPWRDRLAAQPWFSAGDRLVLDAVPVFDAGTTSIE